MLLRHRECSMLQTLGFLFLSLALWALDAVSAGMTPRASIDGLFKLSFVPGPPVPEPATAILLGLGLAGLSRF